MEIEVFRLGHRLPRDERISTHVALVARAFGASHISYSGQHDSGLEDSVKRICASWGSNTPAGDSFSIKYEKNYLRYLKMQKDAGFVIVHLTMYGVPLQDALEKINKSSKILLVVGSEQVPREIYELADFNLSVTSQPHSEVAALAITLDRLMEGKELKTFDFKGRLRIAPSEKGKLVIENG